MDSLTIPEMLSVLAGNWQPLEKVQPVLKEFVQEMTRGDISAPRLEKLADEIVESIKEGLSEKAMPEVTNLSRSS